MYITKAVTAYITMATAGFESVFVLRTKTTTQSISSERMSE